jgi:catechol 2,3-dioxygenase-like lactoylglutathione lyase family enzyme
MRIDHVVYAVRDLDAAAARWRDAYGLESLPGGVHPRWGTRNRLVPFGGDYLELLAVEHADVASGTVLGTRLLDLTADGDRWFSVCVADDAIEATAARVGITVEPGSRTRPDEEVIAWRGAGIDAETRPLDRPFFIAWDVPQRLHPGADALAHPCGATGIVAVEETGDPDGVRAWLGEDLPIEVTPGPPAVVAVRLATPSGELRVV